MHGTRPLGLQRQKKKRSKPDADCITGTSKYIIPSATWSSELPPGYVEDASEPQWKEGRKEVCDTSSKYILYIILYILYIYIQGMYVLALLAARSSYTLHNIAIIRRRAGGGLDAKHGGSQKGYGRVFGCLPEASLKSSSDCMLICESS